MQIFKKLSQWGCDLSADGRWKRDTELEFLKNLWGPGTE
jgi:hypothetical protein